MKFSTRMVLIPEMEYLGLKAMTKATKTAKTIKVTKAVKGRKSRKPVPGRKKLSLAAKAATITQALGKKIRLREQERSKMYRPTPKIIEHIPPIYQNRAKLLLSELKEAGIRHTEKRELVLSSGEVISSSNIVDLLKVAVMPFRADMPKPIGWQHFLHAMTTSTVPKTSVSRGVNLQMGRLRAEVNEPVAYPDDEPVDIAVDYENY